MRASARCWQPGRVQLHTLRTRRVGGRRGAPRVRPAQILPQGPTLTTPMPPSLRDTHWPRSSPERLSGPWRERERLSKPLVRRSRAIADASHLLIALLGRLVCHK
mmetsp:Transcript_25051/g.68802  ORF Transcript_25051/g.68802 Transcript_25051/m.68802 type:complete len:105 (-) Transcript_25051:29-343(-)